MKVLGTYAFLNERFLVPLEKLGNNRKSNQFRIICGCKSRADANRQCERLGIGEKVFLPQYSSETFNEEEIAVAANGGVYIEYYTADGIRRIAAEDLVSKNQNEEER